MSHLDDSRILVFNEGELEKTMFVQMEDTTFEIIEVAPQGIPGLNGKTILNGVGAPGGGTGTDGDFYIDTVAKMLYGPKAAGAWGSPIALMIDGYHVHTEAVAQLLWSIVHNLSKRPSVSVFDGSGNQVEGSIVHTSANALTITFLSAVAGTAYLN